MVIEYKNDKISVIMGIYNCESTLEMAIESIINQTYKNWEFIMCDDGSTDQTYDIAEKYSIMYPDKMILIKNDNNLGLSYSLNHCLKYATGDFVARMDGDDISENERLEIQMAYLLSHPEYQLVGTAMQRFSDRFGVANIQYGTENPNRYSLKYGVPFNHATILTYKHVYTQLGGYLISERTRRSQDHELWFRFYSAGFEGYNLTEPLYRVREDVNAIKRRKFKGRLLTYKTIRIGFKLLNYPWWWTIRPTVDLLKGFVPSKIILLYRRYQGKVSRRRVSR